MKIGVIGDVHWSKYSSIIRSRGNIYSTRLENCIQSVNWAEEETSDCDLVVYLGDFFDKSDLKSEELTALTEIKWNNNKHIFLIGNHELGLNTLTFSSAHIFNITDIEVVNDFITMADGVELCFLSYKLDKTGNIEDYIPKSNSKRIIFSHNDIAGIQLGKFISKSGFSIENIESNCDLFINGHIHNGSKISDKIYNVGNLTGQNFSENAFIYKHSILKIDTDSFNIEEIENPYAFKFFKFDDFIKLMNYDFPMNSVVTAKVALSDTDKVKELIEKTDNIVAHRFIINNEITEGTIDNNISLSVNHLEKFQDFILDRLGSDELVIEEISNIVV